MSNKGWELSNTTKAAFATAGIGLLLVVIHNRAGIRQRFERLMDFRNPLKHKKIVVVETVSECERVVGLLKSHLEKYKVLGFDCEWVTVRGKRQPTALLQLASITGLCALFRLCRLKEIPSCLGILLEDENVLKVGVGPMGDAKNLAHDYGINMAGTFDLRYLAAVTGHHPGGLAKLSKAILNVELDKNWRLAASNWEASQLTDTQLNYAAKDALVGIEIFKKLSNQLVPRYPWQKQHHEKVVNCIQVYIDKRYKDSMVVGFLEHSGDSNRRRTSNDSGSKRCYSTRHSVTRGRALYDNYMLEAPDGELLCTIDSKKSQWYIDRDLAEKVGEDSNRVRLRFEPAGRAVGNPGRYYQIPKENRCVVCGRADCYVRKNVVPHEYRRHFPLVMKTHTSHDVVLLCPNCHQLSNVSDQAVRNHLAEKCNAPIMSRRYEIKTVKRVKNAARDLLNFSAVMDDNRRKSLEGIISEYYVDEPDITRNLLLRAFELDVTKECEDWREHGEVVVEKYEKEFGGLGELERLWRQHFLDTLKPKFMPMLWNVDHNAERLKIRALEGRCEEKDLQAIGLLPSNYNTEYQDRVV